MASQSDGPDFGGSTHRVTLDVRGVEELSATERQARRTEAVNAIVARLPVELRAEGRRLLADPDRHAGLSGSSDPEIARQLSVLASIAELERARAWNETSAQRARAEVARRRSIRVLVALVPQLDDDNARATVIRTAGDRSATVLLRDSDATASDLSAAYHAVRASFQRTPDASRKERRFHVMQASEALADRPAPHLVDALAFLRVQSNAPVPGIGNVRSMNARVLVPEDSGTK